MSLRLVLAWLSPVVIHAQHVINLQWRFVPQLMLGGAEHAERNASFGSNRIGVFLFLPRAIRAVLNFVLQLATSPTSSSKLRKSDLLVVLGLMSVQPETAKYKSRHVRAPKGDVKDTCNVFWDTTAMQEANTNPGARCVWPSSMRHSHHKRAGLEGHVVCLCVFAFATPLGVVHAGHATRCHP